MTEQEILAKVKTIIKNELSIEPEKITMEASLADDLQCDSLDAVTLVMDLEDEFGLKIDDESAQKLKTVGDLVNYIAKNA